MVWVENDTSHEFVEVQSMLKKIKLDYTQNEFVSYTGIGRNLGGEAFGRAEHTNI